VPRSQTLLGILALSVCASAFIFAPRRGHQAVAAPVEHAGVTSAAGPAPLNVAAYKARLLALANLPPPRVVTRVRWVGKPPHRIKQVIKAIRYARSSQGVPLQDLWPAKAPVPDAGALLPFDRIVAYYGNLYSKHMGVLGEYAPQQMLAKLLVTTAAWQAADPTTRAVPALDYIAVAAQAAPGGDGRYRMRMPATQIEKVLALAAQVHGLVFLDVQVGQSNVRAEVPQLAAFLKLPNVELALDPEFAMYGGKRPGTVIGRLDAADINWAAQYLAAIVRANRLTPKILVIHRFTQPMVTDYRQIRPLPEVQIVMDMDGFGYPSQKIKTYEDFIESEPVQFTGFKLFYKNDVRRPGSYLLTPEQILRLHPRPSYIQYQ
jgi:hypothetical protein